MGTGTERTAGTWTGTEGTTWTRAGVGHRRRRWRKGRMWMIRTRGTPIYMIGSGAYYAANNGSYNDSYRAGNSQGANQGAYAAAYQGAEYFADSMAQSGLGFALNAALGVKLTSGIAEVHPARNNTFIGVTGGSLETVTGNQSSFCADRRRNLSSIRR